MSEDLKHLIGKKFRTVGHKDLKVRLKAEIIRTDLNPPSYPILAIITEPNGVQWTERYNKNLKSRTYAHMDLVEINEGTL